ncbi:MFS general substrate transporter [Meredithblackwellia eburnea MCA 4105]
MTDTTGTLEENIKTTVATPRMSSSSLTLPVQQLEDGLGGTLPIDPHPTHDGRRPTEDDKGLVLNKEQDMGVDLEDAQVKEASSDPTDIDVFPEGGLQAYLTVAGGSIALLTSFGLSNSWGVFQDHLKLAELSHYSPSAISWIGSVNLAIVFLSGLPSGRLFDAGHFRILLAGGSIMYLIGIYMMSLSKDYYQVFLSYSVCLAIGSGFIFTPTVSVVGSYFFRKRAVMIGICTGAAAVGSVAYPIMLNKLFASKGFGPAVRIVAYMQTGCFIAANLLMRHRKLPPKVQPPILPLMKQFMHQPTTWMVSLGCAAIIMGLWIPLFYVQTFLRQHNASPTLVTYCLAIINAAAVVSRTSSGLIADHIGIFNTAVPITFATAVLAIAMLGATNGAGSVVWMLLFGLTNGAFVTIITPSLMSLAKDVTEIGVRVGYGFIYVSAATLVGSPVAGALLTSTGTYAAPLGFSAGVTLLGSALLGWARMRQAKVKGTQKV